MNLNELDNLIASINPSTDNDLYTFYTLKRQELVKKIKCNVMKQITKL